MAAKTIAVLGLGSIGQRHAKNLTDLGHNVISYDPLGSNLIADSPQSAIMLSQAVVIASPSPDHEVQLYSSTLQCRHTFVEKPFVTALTGSEELSLAAAKTRGLVVMTGYNLRFHGCVKKAKEHISWNLTGQPLWAHFTVAQYTSKPPYLRDGVILNWSHEIDLALYLLGPAQVLTATAHTTDGNDDIADFVLLHDNGCRTSIHMDYVTKPEERWFSIRGDRGKICANLVTRTYDGPGCKAVMFDSWDQNYKDEMQAFIDRIDGKVTIGATGEEGLEAAKIALKVREMAGLK